MEKQGKTQMKIAVIEDDRPTSDQFRGWIEKACPGVRVYQWFNREDAVRAVRANRYDAIVLDVELAPERNAGVSILSEVTHDETTIVPVLVVSGMPSDVYRGVMKALKAWDYLQKPLQEHEFIETFLDVLDGAKRLAGAKALELDPLRQEPKWYGHHLDLSLREQRLVNTLYEQRHAIDPVVDYQELFDVMGSGKNKRNLEKHISNITLEFRARDQHFDCIQKVALRGYKWVEPNQPPRRR